MSNMNPITTRQLLTAPVHGIVLPNGIQLNDKRKKDGTSVGKVLSAGTRLNISITPSKYDTSDAWKELLSLDTYSDDATLSLNMQKKPRWLKGTHPNLNYRGNSINRTKLWLQQQTDKVLIYSYTGFQYSVAQATADLKLLPCTNALANDMKLSCPGNHWIVTKYVDGKDAIGMHSDKTRNWEKDSSFHVVKFGDPRRFVVQMNDEAETVVFDMKLPAGTSIVCDMYTNSVTKHGVPTSDESVGVSGSIVSRSIETALSVDAFEKRLVKAASDKVRRQQMKAQKNTNGSMQKKRKRC